MDYSGGMCQIFSQILSKSFIQIVFFYISIHIFCRQKNNPTYHPKNRLIKKRCKICHQLKSVRNMEEHQRSCKLTSDFIEFNAREHSYKCLYCEKSFQARMSAVRHFGASHRRQSALKLEK